MCLQEELDIKVLQFQNKKLAERIEQRRKAEDDLRKRIEQLEQRQTTDDAVLCIVNRYWNQVHYFTKFLEHVLLVGGSVVATFHLQTNGSYNIS